MIKWRALTSPLYERDEVNLRVRPALAVLVSISSFACP